MDFERLQLPQGKLPKLVVERIKHPHSSKTPFLKGPVPLNWFQEAMDLGIGALSIGIILWYFRGLKKSKAFKIGIGDMANLINRSWSTAHRGLNALERQRLITLERQSGRKHLVTILEANKHAKLEEITFSSHG